MSEALNHFFNEASATWISGGWLMLPLLFLAVFIYYTALELLIRLNTHFIIRCNVYCMSDSEITRYLLNRLQEVKQLLLANARNPQEVKRHFVEVRNEYLPVVNRRIRFLSIIITAGPLVGLLGTVTGMLSTFSGMVQADGSKFNNVVGGISEALITTQTGLIISIPALIILALIIQKRNLLEHSIVRLERYNTCLSLREVGASASTHPQDKPSSNSAINRELQPF